MEIALLIAQILGAAETLLPDIEGLGTIVSNAINGKSSESDLAAAQAMAATLNSSVETLEKEHGGQ